MCILDVTKTKTHENVVSASVKFCTQLLYRSDHKYCSKCNRAHRSLSIEFCRGTRTNSNK